MENKRKWLHFQLGREWMFNGTYFSPICDKYNPTQEGFMKQSILKIWRNFGYFWQKKQKKYITIKWKELSEIFQNLPFWHRGRVYFMKIIVPCHYNFFSLGPSSREVCFTYWTMLQQFYRYVFQIFVNLYQRIKIKWFANPFREGLSLSVLGYFWKPHHIPLKSTLSTLE